MARSLATIESNSPDSDYLDDLDVATSRLASGVLERRKPAIGIEDWDMIPDADWLLHITDQLRTDQLPDEEPAFIPDRRSRRPKSQAVRSFGMESHTSAVKIVPTRGARFTTGARRVFLMSMLAVIAVAAAVGGSYLLMSTSWLSNLLGTNAPAAPITAPQPPAQDNTSNIPAQPQTQPQSQAPATDPQAAVPSQQSNVPTDLEQSALAGVNARSLRDRGIQEYQAGNFNNAADLLEQSISLDADDPVAQYQLGVALMSTTGRDHAMDDAELAFRTATSLQPDWAAAYQMLSETFLRRNMFAEAVVPALKATELDPTMSQAWMTLGRAYEGAGMPQDAQQAYAKATQLAPATKP